MYYQIKENLISCSEEEALNGSSPYVAVLSAASWAEKAELFNMGIDVGLDPEHPHVTKAEVNFDSVTGSFCIPMRNDICGPNVEFTFALDERGIVFIGYEDSETHYLENIIRTKKWKEPCLERFLFDFLEQIVHSDIALLGKYDAELNKLEDQVLGGNDKDVTRRINEMRGEFLDLRTHYEELMDLAQELEENENNFFREDKLRYFGLFSGRVERLNNRLTSVRDYSVQIRDLLHTQMEAGQNRTMSVLTVVTTVFLPLTLIAGWYGMNFKYMPELNYTYSYPVVIGVCVLIVVGCLIFFKKKKLL